MRQLTSYEKQHTAGGACQTDTETYIAAPNTTITVKFTFPGQPALIIHLYYDHAELDDGTVFLQGPGEFVFYNGLTYTATPLSDGSMRYDETYTWCY